MTLVKDATGKYVSVTSDPVSTPTDSNPSSDPAVQDTTQGVQPTTENNNETTDNQDGLDKSELPKEESEDEKLIRETITKVLEQEKENVIVKQNTVAPELAMRRREGQYRAIDRILRTTGMDNQQADKAMVEIRRILSTE